MFPLGRIPVGTCRIERGEAKKAKKTRGTAGIEPTTSRTRSAVIPFLSRMNHATRPCSPALASAGRDDSKKSVSSEYTMKKTRDPGFDPLISRFDVQLRSKICWRIRNTAKTKQGSSQPHLAKPAAKTSTITEKNAKNAWQPKCSKSERARSPDSAAPRGTARGKPAYATGAFLALAPALVRRRPRRTSRRAKRPSPQPCCDVDRGVSVAFDGVEAPCSLQNESRRWRKWREVRRRVASMASRSRRWRAGGVERWWRRQGQAPAKSQGEPSNAAPRNRQRRFRVKEIMI